MADIFISYSRQDKARVAPLVAALEAEGWSVWWDPAIIPGEEFDDRITEEIGKAGALVVIWTPTSVASRWVRGEAREAADRGILVPVRFDKARLPIDVRTVHTTEFDDWNEDAGSAPFQELRHALSLLLKNVASTEPTAETDRRASICVLPFANMSGDPEQEYFSDGICEDIITDLSKLAALRVISRNSSFTFKGRNVDLPDVARKLKVSHVLEGSVRKYGNRVRVTAQLIDGATNGHVWAERYDRKLDDIFALQDEISEAVVTALKINLLPAKKQALQEGRATNLEAYDKYLRALALRNAGSPGDLRRAVVLLRETLALDPDFAPARATLIAIHLLMLTFMPENVAQSVKELDAAVQDTLARAPDHWAAHLATGTLHLLRQEWLAADTALARATELAPSSEILPRGFYQLLLSGVGRNSEAIGILKATRDVDPLSPLGSGMLQQMLDVAGRPGEAQTEYERTKDLPGLREAAEHEAVMRLWPSGDLAAIRAQAQRFFGSQMVPMEVLHRVYEFFDQPQLALECLRKAFADAEYQGQVRLVLIALYAAHFGDQGLVLAALRRALIEKRGYSLHLLWQPVLGAIRKTPEFKQLLRDLGLYDYWRASGRWGEFARPKGDGDFEIVK